MKKIYVATKFKRRDKAQEVGELLKGMGFEVTARWLEHDPESQAAAIQDIQDVERADALLLLTTDCREGSRGMWFEAGLAFGLGIPVYVLGPWRYPETSIFTEHPHIHKITTLESLRYLLSE